MVKMIVILRVAVRIFLVCGRENDVAISSVFDEFLWYGNYNLDHLIHRYGNKGDWGNYNDNRDDWNIGNDNQDDLSNGNI